MPASAEEYSQQFNLLSHCQQPSQHSSEMPGCNDNDNAHDMDDGFCCQGKTAL
jgi:hypothetical protein